MSVTDLNDPIFDIDKIRIFISDETDRPRSACWTFHSSGDNVYVGPEPTGGTCKLSFHANDGQSRDGCNSQWGLTGQYALSESERGTPNLLRPARWKRPETPAEGFVQVASMMFPTDFLGGTIQPFKPGRKRIALPMAPPGHAIEVGVFYSREPVPRIEDALIRCGGTPIAYITLVGGENVVVAAREVPFDPTAIPPASEWERCCQPLSGAPGDGETFADCGVIMMRERPADGQVISLAEINGVGVARNAPEPNVGDSA